MVTSRGFALPGETEKKLRSNIPPNIKPGATFGITCPAGATTSDKLLFCKNTLEGWGYKIRYGKTIDQKWQTFGGTDDERLADFQQMLDDDTIDVILFARGGYGVMRMMDKIRWDKFLQQPKWLIGYSDITAFHCHIHTNFNIPTIHADMATGFNTAIDDASMTLRNMLLGYRQEYSVEAFTLNRTGNAAGILVGGNLSMMVAVQGSKSALKTDGKILFIEDVSEYKYTIDRMMTNLKRSGMLENLAGLVLGGFTAMKTDEDEQYLMTVEEIIYDRIKEYNYPVAFNVPVGHQKKNYALKIGGYYNLAVTTEKTILYEQDFRKTT